MKFGLSVKFSVLALFLCVSAAFSGAQSQANSGKLLFSARCATCHGSDGKGTTLGKQLKALDLNSHNVQKSTNAELENVIANGKGNMPPFSSTLTKDQIAQLLKYVRTFGKKPR
jgi:mono/diheme cytochrome c family protein